MRIPTGGDVLRNAARMMVDAARLKDRNEIRDAPLHRR